MPLAVPDHLPRICRAFADHSAVSFQVEIEEPGSFQLNNAKGISLASCARVCDNARRPPMTALSINHETPQ
jgi:hypothetical protein